jgi:type VI protein secretion system component VasF
MRSDSGAVNTKEEKKMTTKQNMILKTSSFIQDLADAGVSHDRASFFIYCQAAL